MEIWRDIPGFDGHYQVSNLGRVKSMPRIVVRNQSNGNYTTKEKILRPGLSHGYPTVSLTRNGKSKSYRNHVLVMLAFVGPCPLGQEVLHRDGDRTDATLEHLRYGTRRENMADARLRKTMAGVRNGNSKLTSAMIADIIKAYADFEEELAKVHGVTPGTIRNLKMNRTYARTGTR